MNPWENLSSQTIDAQKLLQLAMKYDPSPILTELQSASAAGTPPGAQTPYSNMTQPGPLPGAAPLDPRSMSAINSMMPQTPKPQFIGGAGVQRPASVKIDIPDISNLVRVNLGQQQGAAVPTLGKLIGG